MVAALNTIARMVSPSASASTLPWQDLRFAHTQAIRAKLLERYAPTTVKRHLSALRCVLREAYKLGLMDHDSYRMAVDLKPARGHRLPAGREVTAGELRALFEVCADGSPVSLRDAALLGLLFGCGLRRAEAAGLDLDGHDVPSGTLRVQGKGDMERIVPLPAGTKSAVGAWRRRRGDCPGPLLLVVRKGGSVVNRGLTTQAIWKRMRYLATKAGVPLLSPHDLRRAYVSQLLDAGADLAVVQRLAGHASPTTTARYDRRGEAAKARAADLLHVPVLP